MSRVVELNSIEEELSFIDRHDRCVIFFGSKMCGHCRDITPFFSEMSKKYPSIAFAHVETSKVEVDNLNGVPIFVAYVSRMTKDEYIVLGASEKELTRMIKSL